MPPFQGFEHDASWLIHFYNNISPSGFFEAPGASSNAESIVVLRTVYLRCQAF